MSFGLSTAAGTAIMATKRPTPSLGLIEPSTPIAAAARHARAARNKPVCAPTRGALLGRRLRADSTDIMGRS